MSHAVSGRAESLDVRHEELAELTAATRGRRRAVDALLPDPVPPDPADVSLAVAGEDGRLSGVAECRRSQPSPGSLDLTWGRADQHRLSSIRLGRDDPDAAMEHLLAAWREELSSLAEPPRQDSAALVTVPSREPTAVPSLLGHGLHPLSVVAVRPAGRRIAGSVPTDVRVRPAARADHPLVVALYMEEIRYDTAFGTVTERPFTEARVGDLVEGLLDDPEPGIWLAERHGRPTGLAVVSPPTRAGWIAPLTTAEPAAYLDCLSVARDERGSGVGTALVDHVHRHLDEAGTAVTLLHYGATNPLSGPFWNRMGYRPLWTSWQAQPVAALR